MYKTFFLCIILGCVTGCFSIEYKQEQARVKYFNRKYMSDAQAFTSRPRRGEPYRTNVTFTLLYPMANNITYEMSYQLKGNPPVSIVIKMCDINKHQWMVDFLLKYANVKYQCPFPAMKYEILNLEFPPKNFPFPIIKGVHRINIITYITDTKELVFHITEKITIS